MKKIERNWRRFLAGWSVKNDKYQEDLENFILKVTPLNNDHYKVPFYIIVESYFSRSFFPDGELSEAKIRLDYSLIRAHNFRPAGEWSGDFRGSYKSYANQLSLTDRAVFLDPSTIQGNRVGTYLFDRIVAWAKEWGDADIDSIGLNVNQATDENKERRNRFYERFGLIFDYGDNREWGRSRPMKAKGLNNVDSWKENIEVLEPAKLMQSLIVDKMSFDQTIQDKQNLIDEYVRKQNNFRKNPISAGIFVAVYNKFWLFSNRVNKKYL